LTLYYSTNHIMMLYQQLDCREYMLDGGAKGQEEEKNSKI